MKENSFVVFFSLQLLSLLLVAFIQGPPYIDYFRETIITFFCQ